MMFKSRLDFRPGVDELLALQSRSVEKLPELVPLQPVDHKMQNSFELLTNSQQGLDELIIEQLSPTVEDKFIMAPSQYERLLLKATEVLFRMDQQNEDSTYSYCAEMLKFEAYIIGHIHSKKSIKMVEI